MTIGTLNILGIPVSEIDEGGLLELLNTWASGDSGFRSVGYANAHTVNLVSADSDLQRRLAAMDLVTCDGFGVALAARLIHGRVVSRMTSPDWIDSYLASIAGASSVFLLGDESEVVELCARRMRERHPLLKVAGQHHGFLRDDLHREDVATRIRVANADVVLVGMGSPAQERWISEWGAQSGANLAVAVGALFRWYSGVEKRAPQWLTRHGVEWATRLARHPIVFFSRYVVGIPRFLIRVAGAARRGGL